MLHLIPVLAAFAAFLALAAAMKRHQRDLAGRTLTARETRCARIAGWLLLALAWLVEAALTGPAMGSIVWFGEISLGAWLTLAAINWKTRAAR